MKAYVLVNPLKENVDDALTHVDIPPIEHVVVLRRTGQTEQWIEGRDLWWMKLFKASVLNVMWKS